MTWHTDVTTRDQLERLLTEIRQRGGTVTSCQRCSEGVRVTWITGDSWLGGAA